MFRSCSASFGARSVARTSADAAGRRLAGARMYSAQAEGEKAGEKKEERNWDPEAEKDSVEVTPEHELLEKLKKKEEEVRCQEEGEGSNDINRKRSAMLNRGRMCLMRSWMTLLLKRRIIES